MDRGISSASASFYIGLHAFKAPPKEHKWNVDLHLCYGAREWRSWSIEKWVWNGSPWLGSRGNLGKRKPQGAGSFSTRVFYVRYQYQVVDLAAAVWAKDHHSTWPRPSEHTGSGSRGATKRPLIIYHGAQCEASQVPPVGSCWYPLTPAGWHARHHLLISVGARWRSLTPVENMPGITCHERLRWNSMNYNATHRGSNRKIGTREKTGNRGSKLFFIQFDQSLIFVIRMGLGALK